MLRIRPEISADIPAIHAVNKQAFDGRDSEPALVAAIRCSESFIPELSLVAEENGRVLGHIFFSRIHIQGEDEQFPALALAPMAVLPEYQRRGIGSMLVRRGLEDGRQLGHKIVIVLGHSTYYPRFGFSSQLAKPLDCPYGDCGTAWMALELVHDALKGINGKVIYPSAFNELRFSLEQLMKTNSKYEIRIEGHLDARWIRQFEDLEILQHPSGETIIAGLMDQATLHGILNRIRDLGLDLISVQRITTENDSEQRTDK